MNAIELKLPDGRITGYACSYCGRPNTSIHTRNRANELEHHREGAERCCLCHACGKPVGEDRAGWYIYCKSCDDARWAVVAERANSPEAIAEREQREAARNAVLLGPCPHAEATLREMFNERDDVMSDLSDYQCAAARVGADALVLWRRLLFPDPMQRHDPARIMDEARALFPDQTEQALRDAVSEARSEPAR